MGWMGWMVGGARTRAFLRAKTRGADSGEEEAW